MFFKKPLVSVKYFLIFFFLITAVFASQEKPYNISLYEAKMTGDSLHNVFNMTSRYDKSYKMLVAAIGSDIYYIDPWLVFEGELTLGLHYDKQDYWETDMALISRWIYFPWNNIIPTSLAFGAGFSYISETSKIEEFHHKRTAHFLGYLVYELEMAPINSSWSVFARVHHRSGAFRSINNVRGASNAFGFGARYRFG